ncbi:unnamed protein product [Cylicocyclus nassatus]|uniref:Uncharacterized protein n=1 Tax=Cylicocyclus nassatus TaxID=53992 RepID=A0AA36H854_CYLNA|nr:unnamed protein product [Cylicocyclus nassatus]
MAATTGTNFTKNELPNSSSFTPIRETATTLASSPTYASFTNVPDYVNNTTKRVGENIRWKETAFLAVAGSLIFLFLVLIGILLYLLRIRIKSGEKCSDIFKIG